MMQNTNKFIITMAKQQNGPTRMKQDLKKIMQNQQQMEREKQNRKSVKDYINQGIEKINQQLQSGGLVIQQKQDFLKNHLVTKNDKYKRQMEMLNIEINKNDQKYKQAKREMLNHKKALNVQQKQKDQLKKKEIQEKIKHWSQVKKQLKEKSERLDLQKKQKQIEQQLRQKQQLQQQMEFKKLQKRKMIQSRLNEIEQNKIKREEMLRNSKIETQYLNPVYEKMKRRFIQLENQMKFQEEIIKKNKKMQMKIDHQSIKAHEKEFLSRLSKRKDHERSSTSLSANEQRKPGFNKFITKDQYKTVMQKQKLKRRKDFQEKLKQIPIVIDEAKKVKVEIQIDKGKNKKKYNFLGQKALNDFQIYGEFREFQLNTNPKQIGNQYLKELPEIIKLSRMDKSKSHQTFMVKQTVQKRNYKNYLQQLKSQRGLKSHKTDDQIKSIINQHKFKEKAFQELNQKIKKYDIQAKRRIQDLQKMNGLRSTLHRTKEIDDLYLKSIKTKLACLEMRE